MMIKLKSLLWILLPFLMFFTLSYTISPTYSSKLDSIVVESVCVVGNENEKYQPVNFVAFVNSQIKYRVYSQSVLTVQNYDGAFLSLNDLGDGYYDVIVESSLPLQTQIILQNQSGYNYVNLHFVQKQIDSLSIVAPINIAQNQDNKFTLLFNNDEKLFYNDVVTYSLVTPTQTITLDNNNTFVTQLTNNYIILNFSSLQNFSGDYTLTATASGKTASLTFKIKQYELTNYFAIADNDIFYILGSSQVAVNLKIQKDKFANFAVEDEFIRIQNAQIVAQDENYDEYALTLDIQHKNSDNVFISCLTTSGKVVRGLTLTAIDNVSSFQILASKTTCGPNETIIITASINGEASLSADIEWFVNNVSVGTGSQLSFARESGGNYSIVAKIGDIESNTLTINVSYQNAELVIWYVLFFIALLLLIMFIIFKKKKKNFYVSANLIDRTRKIMPRFNTQFNNYKKRQFKALIYDVAMLKQDTYKNYKDTRNLIFERAGRELTNVLNRLKAIYKAEKDDHLGAFIENAPSIENSIKQTIECFEEFSKLYPNEKIFAFSLKLDKKEKK